MRPMTRPTGRRRGPQLAAAAGAAIIAADAVGYLWLVERQNTGAPVMWFLAGLGLAACLGLYSIAVVPHRAAALGLGGAIAVVLGILASASVGGPVLLAGFLYWGAAVGLRTQRRSEND